MRKLTLTAEENSFLQDGLCLRCSPSSHFLSTPQSALGPPLEPSGFSLLLLSCPSAISVSLPFSPPSCCLFFPLAILLIGFFLPLLLAVCFFSGAFLPPSGYSPFHLFRCPYFHFLPSRCQEAEIFLVTWRLFLLTAVSLEEDTCSLVREKLLSFQLSCDKKQKKKSGAVQCHRAGVYSPSCTSLQFYLF